MYYFLWYPILPPRNTGNKTFLKSIVHTIPPINPLASDRVLGRAVRIPNPPMSLVRDTSILPDTNWLPWLIERLEREDVHAPIEDPADPLRPERRGIGGPWDGILVFISSSRPSCRKLASLSINQSHSTTDQSRPPRVRVHLTRNRQRIGCGQRLA